MAGDSLDGKVDIILDDLRYNVRNKQNMENSSRNIFPLEVLSDFADLARQVIAVGAHRLVLCSQMQFSKFVRICSLCRKDCPILRPIQNLNYNAEAST